MCVCVCVVIVQRAAPQRGHHGGLTRSEEEEGATAA